MFQLNLHIFLNDYVKNMIIDKVLKKKKVQSLVEYTNTNTVNLTKKPMRK